VRPLARAVPALVERTGAEQLRRATAFLAGDESTLISVRSVLARASWRFRSRLRLPWEDLQQELLLELTAALQRGAFRGEAQLETYAWRVAQCACINRLRAERRERELAPASPLLAPGEPPRSALQRVLDDEALRRLVQRLARLPAECRRLWSMIAEGLSYDEMSAATGVAAGTLRVRVLRCRRKAQELPDIEPRPRA
jgi:RNA polymerase sigma factor (sigma-70 family)